MECTRVRVPRTLAWPLRLIWTLLSPVWNHPRKGLLRAVLIAFAALPDRRSKRPGTQGYLLPQLHILQPIAADRRRRSLPPFLQSADDRFFREASHLFFVR